MENYKHTKVGGDPRCSANTVYSQKDSPSNGVKRTVEISGENVGLPDKIEVAAQWLSRNRESVRGPLLPFIRRTFDLELTEAIDASRRAHALEYTGS